MRSRWTILAVLAVVLAACGGGDDQAADETTTTSTPDTTTTAVATPGVELATTTLGEVLVGPNGMTLYGFTVDDPGVSNCYDDCETTWPPLPGDTPTGEGLDESLFSTTERNDGTTQLVIGDSPLYYFAGDAAPGDVNGQGVNDVWFVVTADGELVGGPEATEEETSDTTATRGGNYDVGTTAGITVAETELGPTLVDADGLTLYGFTPDSPTASTCNGPCADSWPPVAGDAVVSDDLDQSLLSTITRDDGSTQLVFGDWPLYRFAGDSTAGDINGQGVNDVWFVIGPDATLYR